MICPECYSDCEERSIDYNSPDERDSWWCSHCGRDIADISKELSEIAEYEDRSRYGTL